MENFQNSSLKFIPNFSPKIAKYVIKKNSRSLLKLAAPLKKGQLRLRTTTPDWDLLEERVVLPDGVVGLDVEADVVLRHEEVPGGGHLLPVEQGGVAVGQVPLTQRLKPEVLVQHQRQLVT